MATTSNPARSSARCVEIPGRPDPRARLRLFCFPYAGGGAAVYRSWSTLLPAEIQLAPVTLRGRGSRFTEAPLERLDEVTESLAEELAPYLDMPFAFFGHSMGALIAYELTRLLRGRGGPLPEHLLVSGRRAPQVPSDRPDLHTLPEPDLKEELRRLDGTPEEIIASPELMELFLPILRADFSVCETYRYREEAPLDCPVSAFGGLEDRDVAREHVEAWRTQARGPFRVRMFPGGHFFLNGGARDALVRAVTADLAAMAVR